MCLQLARNKITSGDHPLPSITITVTGKTDGGILEHLSQLNQSTTICDLEIYLGSNRIENDPLFLWLCVRHTHSIIKGIVEFIDPLTVFVSMVTLCHFVLDVRLNPIDKTTSHALRRGMRAVCMYVCVCTTDTPHQSMAEWQTRSLDGGNIVVLWF